jgi:hypothetical protein
MALVATTLSSAALVNDTTLNVASASNISAPIFNTGVGITYLYVEQEYMLVLGVAGTVITVQRGILGSCASPHGASCPVVSGLPTDFAAPPISIKAQQDFYPNQIGFSAPVVGANTNVATGPYFHLSGTTIMKTLTAPSLFGTGGALIEGGQISIVFDGSAAGLTWDATGNIAVAGTATTAGSMVTFTFDLGSGKWHPSRLA